jgi:hypothetical protein
MSRLSRIALAAALVVALAIAGAPVVSAAPAAGGRLRTVGIVSPRWVYRDGDLPVGVRVVTRQNTGRVRADLDLLDSSGVSLWHVSQTRPVLGSVTFEFSFSRRVADIGAPAGVYTLRARVSGAGTAAIERTSQLIVVDRDVRAVPVCVVVRVTGTPALDVSPTSPDTGVAQLSASDAADLGRLAMLHPELHLSIAVPPFLLDQWRAGGPSGAATSAPGPWSDALNSLRSALRAGTPVLRGMYADPDLAAIASEPVDIGQQLAFGDKAIAAALAGNGTAATGLAVMSGALPESAALVSSENGVRFAVVDPSSVRPAGGSAAVSGPYAISVAPRTGSASASASMTLLALDAAASRMLATSPDALAADLLGRAVSSHPGRTVVIEAVVGPYGVRTSALEQALRALGGIPWIRFVDAPAAAAAPGAPKATLNARPAVSSPAPSGYGSAIDSARGRVLCLVAAAGADDRDAALALGRLLLSESRAWAGVDGSWAGAAQGLALAKSAEASARAVLSKVTLDAPAVTLPGSEGKVPVSVTNSSGRTLSVVLEASSSELRVRKPRTTVRLKPGENVLSVPVVMGTASTGRLTIRVTAGGYEIAGSTAAVRASYQDRIVLLITVVLVLLVLLFYIRRRITRGRDA